ncbi:hypothetical protein L1987_88145 [Smallanthus sonchifolius]|nr:hypothetical protein L1987_88145 [Smallanthus sonchifolius]
MDLAELDSLLRHIKNGVRYRESFLFTVYFTFTQLKELCHKFIRTAICRASIASSPLVRYQAYSLEGDRWPQTCKSQLFVHIQAFVPHVRASRISTYFIGAGTATIALAGAAVGIGKIFSSLIHSVARSP